MEILPDSTCGFIDGDHDSPFNCGVSGQICILRPFRNRFVCCDSADPSCVVPGACIDQSSGTKVTRCDLPGNDGEDCGRYHFMECDGGSMCAIYTRLSSPSQTSRSDALYAWGCVAATATATQNILYATPLPIINTPTPASTSSLSPSEPTTVTAPPPIASSPIVPSTNDGLSGGIEAIIAIASLIVAVAALLVTWCAIPRSRQSQIRESVVRRWHKMTCSIFKSKPKPLPLQQSERSSARMNMEESQRTSIESTSTLFFTPQSQRG